MLGPYLLGAYARGARGGGWRALGIALIATGALMVLRCDFDFVTRGKGTPAPPAAPLYLVTNTLYRWTRNPMYVGMLLVLAGEAALFGNMALAIYWAAAGLGFHLFVILYEEPHLTRIFGESYRNYCAQVPRWLPKRIRRD
jgi:protein-S-isoprenylcysteine O-methyltransferase Ste14